MFRTVPLSIIRSFSLYTQQWYMPYRFAGSSLASCQQTCTHCCVYSEKLLMMDRGTVRNIQLYSKNKFEKLVHLVGFTIRISRITVTMNSDCISKQHNRAAATPGGYELNC